MCWAHVRNKFEAVFKACKEKPDHKDLRATTESKGFRVHKGFRDFRVHKVIREFKDRLDLKEMMVLVERLRIFTLNTAVLPVRQALVK